MQQVGWIKDVNAFSDCRKVFAALAVAIEELQEAMVSQRARLDALEETRSKARPGKCGQTKLTG